MIRVTVLYTLCFETKLDILIHSRLEGRQGEILLNLSALTIFWPPRTVLVADNYIEHVLEPHNPYVDYYRDHQQEPPFVLRPNTHMPMITTTNKIICEINLYYLISE